MTDPIPVTSALPVPEGFELRDRTFRDDVGEKHEKTMLRWFGWHRGNALTPSTLVGAGWLTREECAAAMEAAYGYLRERPDLRAAPHFWNIPKPVRCRVVVTTLKPVTGIILK